MPNTKNAPAKKSSARKRSNAQGDGNSQLQNFFTDSIKDIYWAEKALTKALPKMQKAATTDELKTAIGDHLEQTKGHVERLEQVFELIGEKAQAKKCDAMEGLLKEGDSTVEETEDGSMTRDAAIIMAAQKVEHYEIATYGGLVQLASVLGMDEASDILAETLREEKDTDQGLSEIAENNINWAAEQEDEDDEEDK